MGVWDIMKIHGKWVLSKLSKTRPTSRGSKSNSEEDERAKPIIELAKGLSPKTKTNTMLPNTD